MPNDPTSATTAEVIACFNAAFDRHDLTALRGLLAADVVFEATSPAPDGTRYTGRDALLGVLETILADTASRIEVEETVICGGRAVQRAVYSWSDGHVRGVDLVTVTDGLITEILAYVKG